MGKDHVGMGASYKQSSVCIHQHEKPFALWCCDLAHILEIEQHMDFILLGGIHFRTRHALQCVIIFGREPRQ